MHFPLILFVTVAQFWGSIFYVLTFCTNLTTIVLRAPKPPFPKALFFLFSCSFPFYSQLFLFGALRGFTSNMHDTITYFLDPSCIFRIFMIYCLQYVTGGFYVI